MTAAELRALIAATPGAVEAVFGTFSTPALLDFEGRGWGPEGQAQVEVAEISMTYCYPDLPGLAVDGSLSVDGETYTVRAGPRRKGEGLVAVVLLENA